MTQFHKDLGRDADQVLEAVNERKADEATDPIDPSE